MKVEYFITVAIFLTCVSFTFSLANVSYSSTQPMNEKAVKSLDNPIEIFEPDYEAIIYEQTGFEVDVDSCRLYMCMYPAGHIDKCITNAGPIFVMRDKGQYTVKAGSPPEFRIELIKTPRSAADELSEFASF